MPALVDSFVEDFYDRARLELRGLGFTEGEVEDLDDPVLMWFAHERRRIAPQPRTPHESPTLSRNQMRTDHAAAVDEIVRRSQLGEDLHPYLSRLMKRLDFQDALLNDWGIYHFHLGKELEGDGYIKRTGDLLYALVTADALYLVDIKHHGSFEDDELLEVVHRTWPELIERHRARGIAVTQNLSQEQRRNVRRNGVTACFVAGDGTTYFPPGGGYMGNRGSAEALVSRDYWVKTARANAAFLEPSWESIRSNVAAALGLEHGDVDLHLHQPATQAYDILLVERSTGNVVTMRPPDE